MELRFPEVEQGPTFNPAFFKTFSKLPYWEEGETLMWLSVNADEGPEKRLSLWKWQGERRPGDVKRILT